MKAALTLITPATITIDSINASGTNLRGAAFTQKLSFQPPPIDRWMQPTFGLPAGTSQIDVHFTFKNTTRRVLSGIVGGLIDNVALSQFPVANLANGGSVSDKVSFHPLNVAGDYVITLTFREPLPGPIVPISAVLAQTTANYFVY
jgi:hypothetical protein